MDRSRKSPSSVVGWRVAPHRLIDMHGRAIALPDADRLTHLQFRRFAGCPVCNLHLRSFVRRNAEIEAAGIREVVVFHSSAEDLLVHAGELPFAVIADPTKALYAEFGVDASVRALLDPRVWPFILAGVARSAAAVLARREALPPLDAPGGRLGRPADFLIAPDGRVLASRRGVHAYDQWSVDDLLALASRAEVPRRRAA